jgi:phospholipase/carboxylesterase
MGLSPANPRPATGTVVVGHPLQTASLAVVVVHGRDQDPHWMLEHLVGRLDLPRAAFILPTIAGRSWYPGRFFDPAANNEPWVSEALQTCADAVALAEDAGMPVDRIVLVGFSQGACLVAEALERDPRPYAAAAILTGGLIGSEEELHAPPESLEGMRVLISGHVDDDWVPVPRVVRTAELLREADASVELAIHDDPEHQINDDEVAAVRRLLIEAGAEWPRGVA